MMRIVLVDDAKDDLALMERILVQCKLKNPVILTASARECINHIECFQEKDRAHPEAALILLDLIMPQASGLRVLEYLSSSPYREHCIPVMLSGLQDIKAINQGYQLGAKTFLLKPLTTRDVVELINSLGEQIAVEEQPGGYVLHWKTRLASDTTFLTRRSRLMTFPA